MDESAFLSLRRCQRLRLSSFQAPSAIIPSFFSSFLTARQGSIFLRSRSYGRLPKASWKAEMMHVAGREEKSLRFEDGVG